MDRLLQYIDAKTLLPLEDIIGDAIPLALKIVEDRNISEQVKAEDAGFYDDPFIIPTTLAEYTQAGPASIVAALLFASLRPVRGGNPELSKYAMEAVQDFVDTLPEGDYSDVPDIILGALRMRALEPPEPWRPIRSLEDLLAEPEVEVAKNNQRRVSMIRIEADDDRATTLRLAQQLVRLQKLQKTLPEMTDAREREALLKELYYMRYSYIPLADRLGQGKLVQAMQDEVLRLADPVMHRKLHEYIVTYTDRFEDLIDPSGNKTLIDTLRDIIGSKLKGIEGLEIKGRVKSAYSLWLKMHEKKITLENIGALESKIFDYIGLTASFDFSGADDMGYAERRGNAQAVGIEIFERLRQQRSLFTIVQQTEKLSDVPERETDATSPPQSYKARKRRQKIAKPAVVEGEEPAEAPPVMVDMRNYMETPKANGYRAIHVLIKVKVAKGIAPLIDLHIVWKADDINNTYGNASHANFKTLIEGSAAAKALQSWRAAGNEVYVQVGDGRIRRFQKGSTVADVAERIHTGMVAIAKGAKVTRTDPTDTIIGRNRPLHAEVKNGDRVVVLLHGTEHLDRLVRDPLRRRYILRHLRRPAERNLKSFYDGVDKATRREP